MSIAASLEIGTKGGQNPGLYSRAKMQEILGIRSKNTLTKYCRFLGIPDGVYSFNQVEHDALTNLHQWRLRGASFKSYFECNSSAHRLVYTDAGHVERR
jgi:hypothetical protein